MSRARLLPVSVALLTCALVLGGVSLAAGRDFNNPASNDPSQQFSVDNPQRHDTPNDSGYDNAELNDEDGSTSTNLYDEAFGFFGFASQLTRLTAIYSEGPHFLQPMVSGFNASGAWKLERGRADAVVAILDTGIKWDKANLRLQIHLNPGELPAPNHARATPVSDAAAVPACSAFTAADDANGDGKFSVLDFVCDTRVSAGGGAHGNASLLDGEDLIAAFSNSADTDTNGFIDDIAGWDFFDNDNNPYDASSYFAAANHGSGRGENVAEQGNDGSGGIGVCPGCQLMPIRTWDTFVSDGNDFGMGMLYATDNGASVIEGANGSLYHSAFAEQASEYAYEHGLVQTYSGDDLNTGDHNFAGQYGHAMLIQGTVPDSVGLGASNDQYADLQGPLCSFLSLCLGSNVPVGTYFRGANTTQYGGKSSISMEGTTGSENTGKAAGAAALVISAARNASPAVQLRPDETRVILEQTAERVTGGATGSLGNVAGVGNPDPGANPAAPYEDQWTTHFGWGRVNLGAAVALAQSGDIPPQAAISSPDFFAPVTGDSVDITGLARARFATAGHFTWKLEWGAGEAPASWNVAQTGSSDTSVMNFGSIDMNAVRTALASYTPPVDPGGPTLSSVSTNPYKNEFTVRVTVTGDDIPTLGIDRRVLTSAKDTSLRAGFPKRMGTGGEAPIRYADINGDNVQELLVPTEDGLVHAYRPNGSELPGWPVHTLLQRSAVGHGSAPGFAALAGTAPPRDAPRGPVVADLDGDGRPEIIVTAGTRIYVWEPDGSTRPGFPVSSNLSFCVPSLQSQPLRHPKCGFIASAAVGHLQGPNQPLDIVVPSLDGHLYAIKGDGRPLPGYPIQLVDPGEALNQMFAESINEPAIGDLNGDGKDDVVAATNETYDPVDPSQGDLNGGLGEVLTSVLAQAAGGSTRVYAIDGPSGQFLPGWPIKLDGAIQDTLPMVGPGQDPEIVKVGGQTRVVAGATGSVTIGQYNTAGALVQSAQQSAYGAGSDATDHSGALNLFESAAIGKLIPGGNIDIVKYGLSLADVANLLLSGQNFPYNHLMGAYDTTTGAPEPAYPRITDDFQFLSSPEVANVNGGTANHVVAGTGLGLLHAYDGLTGLDAPGFPKVTGGWLFAPAALSDDGRIADITREGYLFEWDQPSLPRCQSEWAQFRHDQQHTGNYDKDGTPPSKPTSLVLSGGQITFNAPGDDGTCGTADHYEIVTSYSQIKPTNFAAGKTLAGAPVPAAWNTGQSYTLPAHRRFVAIRAIDEAGNVGWSALIDTGLLPGRCSNPQIGTAGKDRLRGTGKGDRLIGRSGNDKLLGLGAGDCLSGGTGKDRLRGGRSNDVLKGGRGNDFVKGDGGNDLLIAGPGKDRVLAFGGRRDVVRCGPGKDTALVDRQDVVKGCEKVIHHRAS